MRKLANIKAKQPEKYAEGIYTSGATRRKFSAFELKRAIKDFYLGGYYKSAREYYAQYLEKGGTMTFNEIVGDLNKSFTRKPVRKRK